MTRINLNQRTEEWTDWRKGKIGSSSASSIMGLNTYKSALQLWQEMKGLKESDTMNPAMQRGVDLEPDALFWVIEQTGRSFTPECFEHDEFPFLIASLDGLSVDGSTLVEIKVSDKRVELAKRGKISDMDNCQLQHQMMITGISKALFCAFDGFDGIILHIDRDDAFIEQLKQKEIEFYEFLKSDLPPDDEKEFVKIQIDDVQAEVVKNWIIAHNTLKMATDVEKRLRSDVTHFGNGDSICVVHNDISLIRLQCVQRQGSIDWEKLCEDKGISKLEIEKYRKKETQFYKISLCK